MLSAVDALKDHAGSQPDEIADWISVRCCAAVPAKLPACKPRPLLRSRLLLEPSIFQAGGCFRRP